MLTLKHFLKRKQSIFNGKIDIFFLKGEIPLIRCSPYSVYCIAVMVVIIALFTGRNRYMSKHIMIHDMFAS